MTYNYTRARKIALRQITKYGGAGQVILQGVTGGYDNSGNVIANTPDTIINGTITPLVDYKTSEIDGESIKKGDAWVYFHSDSDITVNMQTTLNGTTFRILAVKTLSSVGGIEIFTKLQLRV